MDEIKVPLGERTYPIFIGNNVFDRFPEYLNRIHFPKRLALITNTKVEGLYAKNLSQILQAQNFFVSEIVIPDGEEYKNLNTLEYIYDELIKNNFDRSTGLIALGGGVVGDIVGFAAATFLRGVPFVQCPTTLLAQVDSSVGGKTAVNHSLGKNLIGAFYQPKMVFIDVATLDTLEPREVAAGMAEVVKYGVIKDEAFFRWLEQHYAELQSLQAEALISVVKKSCQIKADIVEVDEKEGSVRAFLNYGHTFGHAIESLSGYGQWKHGEAVAVGMVVAAKISALRGLCTNNDVARIVTLLTSLNLPVEPPPHALDDYVTAMQHDKKIKHGTLTLVLNNKIGNVELVQVPDIATVFSEILTS